MGRIAQYFLVFYSTLAIGTTQPPTPNEWIKSGSIALLAAATNATLFFVPTPVCAWCKSNNFDTEISRALVVKDLEQAATLSHLLTLGVIPAAALASTMGGAKSGQALALNTLVLFDSAMTTLAITQAIKVSARRQIPQVYFRFPYADNRYKNQAFLSGHTSFAFSLLTTASVLAFREKAPWAPYFTAFAACAGLLVGYSRIASGKHWASDVLAGMGLGVGVGLAIPFFIYEQPTIFSHRVALSIGPTLVDKNLFIQISY